MRRMDLGIAVFATAVLLGLASNVMFALIVTLPGDWVSLEGVRVGFRISLSLLVIGGMGLIVIIGSKKGLN